MSLLQFKKHATFVIDHLDNDNVIVSGVKLNRYDPRDEYGYVFGGNRHCRVSYHFDTGSATFKKSNVLSINNLFMIIPIIGIMATIVYVLLK